MTSRCSPAYADAVTPPRLWPATTQRFVFGWSAMTAVAAPGLKKLSPERLLHHGEEVAVGAQATQQGYVRACVHPRPRPEHPRPSASLRPSAAALFGWPTRRRSPCCRWPGRWPARWYRTDAATPGHPRRARPPPDRRYGSAGRPTDDARDVRSEAPGCPSDRRTPRRRRPRRPCRGTPGVRGEDYRPAGEQDPRHHEQRESTRYEPEPPRRAHRCRLPRTGSTRLFVTSGGSREPSAWVRAAAAADGRAPATAPLGRGGVGTPRAAGPSPRRPYPRR